MTDCISCLPKPNHQVNECMGCTIPLAELRVERLWGKLTVWRANRILPSTFGLSESLGTSKIEGNFAMAR